MDRGKVIEELEAVEILLTNALNRSGTITLRGASRCLNHVTDALTLLKEQDERYVNMVVSWLNEMALNNCQDEKPMTFADAIENIRDRASCGLKQYFNDKLNEKTEGRQSE